MKLDFADVARSALTQSRTLLPRWLPGGRIDGHEFKAGSVQGEKGSSLSINLNTGQWADFSTDEKGGDLISLFAAIRGMKQIDSMKDVAEQIGMGNVYQAPHRDPAPAEPPPADDWQQIIPAIQLNRHVIRHSRYGEPSRTWRYQTGDGSLIGFVCRFDLPDGKKEVLPYCYGQAPGQSAKWRWKSFTDPRPLYNLDKLAAHPKTNVIIVEGEKTADAGSALFPKQVVTTWPGGGKAIDKVDWSPLAGRKVILWADADAKTDKSGRMLDLHDQPGAKAMLRIGAILSKLDCTVQYVQLPIPGELPDGWDIADAEWTPEQAMAQVKANLVSELANLQIPAPIIPQNIPEPDDYPDDRDYTPDDAMPLPRPEREIQPLNDPSELGFHVFNDAPFRCLGKDKENYFYFSEDTQNIHSLTPAAHSKNQLMSIADFNYWRMTFPKGKTADFDLDAAVNAMMRGCSRVGFFNAKRIRGRGAWYDEGRVVVHLGNRVIVNGKELSPARVKSKFIYERGEDMAADLSSPLGNRDAYKFVALLDMLSWDRPIYAKLAAGWCVVAHIGGVLKWRPHVWVIGQKGSGKTYVMSNVIKPVLGDNHLFFQASSTEAGIRQELGSDSLPVLFDEAEGEDQRAHENIQRVLQLVRQSSSDTGGRITKGTPGGKALRYDVRSCFAFSSINANLVQQSDKSRVTVLELNSDKPRFPFNEITAAEAELLTEDYIRRFYARAIALAPIVRDNAVTFARAAATALGEQRAGDQIGTLLAGAYALHSDKMISLDDAIAWVEAQDWSETKDEIKGMSDQGALWSYLLQQKLRVKQAAGTETEVPVGLLIDVSRALVDGAINADTARERLMQNGFKVDGGKLFISNTSPHIGKMLQGTPWATNWSRVLKRLPNAHPAGVIYFGYSGSESRAIEVPL
jgi:putative DNA primase/helicase